MPDLNETNNAAPNATAEPQKPVEHADTGQGPMVHGLPEGGIPRPPEHPIIGKFWPKPTRREWTIILIIALGFALAGLYYGLF